MQNGLDPAALRSMHTLFNLGAIGSLSDAQLLERFNAQRGEAAELAFAALAERHGAMVFRVCRAILRNHHQAEDAFQATFLVLARKASALRVKDSLGPWLHSVACRTAACARAASARRRKHEQNAAEIGGKRVCVPDWDDLAGLLHEELARLPAQNRMAIVLCDLEGQTHASAARQLGWPVGTLQSRLARGRDKLRRRLIRLGLAPSIGLRAILAADSASASVPPRLVANAARAGVNIVSGQAAGTVSSAVVSLSQGVLSTMFWTKIKALAAVAIGIGALTAGAGVLAQPQGQEASGPTAEQELQDLERAWGVALVQHDAGTVDRIVAYEMVGTEADGQVWDKARYLEQIQSGGIGADSYALGDLNVRIFGNAAIVTGASEISRGGAESPGTSRGRFTKTYIRRQGAWQCVAWQTADITPGPGAQSAMQGTMTKQAAHGGGSGSSSFRPLGDTTKQAGHPPESGFFNVLNPGAQGLPQDPAGGYPRDMMKSAYGGPSPTAKAYLGAPTKNQGGGYVNDPGPTAETKQAVPGVPTRGQDSARQEGQPLPREEAIPK